MSYQGLDLDEDAKDSSHSRRLSLKPQDLPIFTMWSDRCGDCCKKKATAYDQMQSMLDDEEEVLSGKGKIPKSAKDKKAEEKLMAEQCLDATVNKIVNNLSWVNATLLAVAMKNTLEINFTHVGNKYSTANNAWIYFFVIFILGIILAVVPRAFEDLNEMKRELNLNATEKKILHGDRDAIEELAQKKQEKVKEDGVKKVYDFVEVEANELVEKFEDLFVDTLSNTVSMAWRDAAKATFALMISSASATATAYFFYALFMTMFGLYLVIRIGGIYEKKENEMQKYLQEYDERFNTHTEEKRLLLKFAFVKRSIKLTQTVIKFAIAWSWRDCINSFIHAIYGGNSNDGTDLVGEKWGYFITIAIFVSIAFSFSEQFHILYPKNTTKEEEQIFLKDKSRITVNNVLYDNLRFVVGMALFDAFIISLESLKHGSMSNSLQCLLYWVVAIGGISFSVVGTNYTEKWGLRKKIADKGVSQAMFDTFERFYDPLQELHIEGDRDFVPMIVDMAMFEFVYVSVFGLGIAGSMGTTNAIKFTINSMTSGSGLYDLSHPDVMQSGVWIVWVSFGICLIVSTVIIGYFARLIGAMKDGRRKLFKKFKNDDEIKKRDQESGLSKRFSLDNKEEEEEESDQELQEENEQDKNKRKRNVYSTKAEDEGDLGGDFDGGDDAGDDGGGDDGGDGGDGGK